MTVTNQTANRWRLGPRVPTDDLWGVGVWDSNCDLYDIESDEKIDTSAIGTFTAPIIALGGATPPMGSQVIFGILTPPCDRFTLYVTYLKQAGSVVPTIPVHGNQTPLAPWTIQLQRGMDCVDEPNTPAPLVKFGPPNADGGKGLIMELKGTPLSTWWVFYAFQTVTPGANIAWSGNFRVMADRRAPCCEEDAQLGPNSSLIG